MSHYKLTVLNLREFFPDATFLYECGPLILIFGCLFQVQVVKPPVAKMPNRQYFHMKRMTR